MFEMMRRHTKLIMWITAGSFVLLIFLAWGAEYQLGREGGGPSAGVIGRVNGESITARVYQDRIMAAREQYMQNQGQNPDENAEVQLRDTAWNNLIQEILLKQEIGKRKIRVSDREIAEAIRNNPLPMIMQAPEFQTNGQFDYNKYLAALSDQGRDWLPLEMYYREDLPKQKLQQIVMASVKVGEAEIRRRFEDENTKAKVTYAFLPAGRFTVEPSLIDDAATGAYYDAHKDDYRVEEQAVVQYVRIEKKPTISDSLSARDLIQQAANEAKAGEDFTTLVKAYSEAPVQLQGGEQGAYMTKDQFSAPKVRDVAFAIEVGAISDVIQESNGFHLLKLEDRRMNADKEEVKIADIFVPIGLSAETISGYRDRAVALVSTVRENGGDLAEAAKIDGLAPVDAGPFGRRSYVPRVGQLSGFMDWAFNAQPGKTTAMEAQDSWYVVKLVRRRPAGLPPLSEVTDRVRTDTMLSKQNELAAQAAQKILDAARGGTSLEGAVKADANATLDTTDEFTRRGFARGLGNDPAVMARVFSDPIGLVPDVISTKRGAYVIQILSRTPPDEVTYAQKREAIRQQLGQTKRRELVNRWMEDLRSQAKIEDYRTESEIG